MEDNINLQPFTIRAYSKQELANLYFPDAAPHIAVNRLNRWIKQCHPLSQAMEGIHYNKNRKYFTPQEVALIASYLGTP